jgi:hypothetical protein
MEKKMIVIKKQTGCTSTSGSKELFEKVLF